ncbi:DNA-binding GntR family transcriptional regulator [Sedimentibacter acidaminivorans]|uniref:DNA-binding GntR family transcriptional regulator n=1 Tax=Sedimentibacter acidaminivorans TaxID=913099 RepID=A0ABS4GH38_9FIRM|nr:helix-turn-helix domain-containing protein [Sedimentibacter acidaminivorans]MBP1926700.1 DNA-binding GntR family transcriptional regulator [Sedimentibacter acidaminivorans]
MSNTITMSNYIFNNQIDVHSKIVYAGLKKFSNGEGICFPSRSTLVELCKISLSTVRKAINSLVDAKILDKQERYRENGSQTSNLYSLTPFMASGDYYFKVRSDIFDLQLSEKEIIVYMYLCSCANKENECYPSLRQITAACSISQTSVKIAMKELVERKLILKDNQYRENGGRRNNLYKIVTEEDDNINNNQGSETNDEAITHELCSEDDNQIEIIDCKEIDEIILENSNEVEDINVSIQDNHVFDTDVTEQKLKVYIRDDIFNFKMSKHSMLVYLYICTHSDLKTKHFPSYEQIANTCKISIAKVANAILELKTNGLIGILKQEKVDDNMDNIEPPPWTI